MATGLLAFGLVVTCLAGYRALLLGVDLVRGSRPRFSLQPADVLLLALSLLGLVMLVAGALMLRAAGHGY